MSESTSGRSFETVTDRQLQYAAVALIYVVAAVHLFHPTHGVARLVLVLMVDPALLVADPRPLLFTLSGVGLILAVPAVSLGAPKRLLYRLGVVLMGIYLGGYFTWHLTGHGGFLPGREPVYHGMAPHEAVISHLGTDPYAAIAVVTELALAGLLVGLLLRPRQ